MKFYLKILFFIYSFFSSAVVLADEISLKTQILKLDTKDFEKKISIIEEISFNKSEFALSALKGILSGRIFIRKSGTQPHVRILIENQSEEILKKAEGLIKTLL